MERFSVIRVGVITVARSDFSILRPLMHVLANDPKFELTIIVAGAHLSPTFGMTVQDLEADGFTPTHRVEMLLSSDTPVGTAKSIGIGMLSFADIYAGRPLDLIVAMGDRLEMFSAVAAALPFCIPVAHIHGGELSEGAIDDSMRHAITKMSHLHFVSTQAHRNRVIQLGELPERVIVSGAPALDNLRGFKSLTKQELSQRFKVDLAEPPLVVTFHSTTLELEHTEHDTMALLESISATKCPVIFTAPNADTGGHIIRQRIAQFVADKPRAWLVENFGIDGYYSLLQHASAMVGNSSSGIIEAASFRLPVVNVGNRQKNRIAGANVLHVPAETDAISAALVTALSHEFRSKLDDLVNPYGDGRAVERIVSAIQQIHLSSDLCIKRFHNVEPKLH